MKLKKLNLCILLSVLGLTSCNLENDPDNNNTVATFNACNLIIPFQGDAFAMPASYALTIYPYEESVTLGTDNLNLGMADASFVTTGMKYTYNSYTVDMRYLEVMKFSGGSSTSGNLTISNLKGYTSSLANVPLPNDPNLAQYPFVYNMPLVVQYRANDFEVKTFMPDAIYSGSTVVRTQSTGNSYTNDGIRYRVFFRSDMQHADLLLYDAKFDERMPALLILFENLEINYTSAGYTISLKEGTTSTPSYWEGGEFTPFPMYTLNSLLFNNSSSDLTSATLDFNLSTPSDKFYVQFSGSYVSDKLPD